MKISDLPEHWDLIVIGGGITGAAVLLEAARRGFHTLLLEGRDFAWGTSSRSSKLVHGGLRYLRQGRFDLTRTAVKAREALLDKMPGLVDPLAFFVPLYRGRPPGRASLRIGLNIYDLIAGRRTHRYLRRAAFIEAFPGVSAEALVGAYRFEDAQTDDARLVLRLIQAAGAFGGTALNYTRVEAVARDRAGRVVAVAARDEDGGLHRRLTAGAVINATGVGAGQFGPLSHAKLHLRPLRGSHLVISSRTLPLAAAISFAHPGDDRGVFALPWENAVLIGTTDLDHHQDLDAEPRATRGEIAYLLEAVNYLAPGANFGRHDILSIQTGVRPVVGRGHRPPSDESREHVVWAENGLVTVTGGKLTTFQRLARDALTAAAPWLPRATRRRSVWAALAPGRIDARHAPDLDPGARRRLAGRYGAAATDIVTNSVPADLSPVESTLTLWAELPHAARNEQVRHLTDLMLRRVRLGLLLPEGGRECLPRIRRLCQPALGWDDARWQVEEAAYLAYWRQYCRPEY
jgi:glycerol-3-phosphate dehydrogenase